MAIYMMREWWWWTPWANTVGYRPLDATNRLNDLSWNGYNLLDNAGYTFWTYQWVSCVSMSWANNNSHLNNTYVPFWNNRTALAWIYCTRTQSADQGVVCIGTDYNTQIVGMWVQSGKGYVTDRKTADTAWTTNIMNAWHLIALTRTSGSWIKLYIDWVLEATSPSYTRSSGTWLTIGSKTFSSGASPWTEAYQGYISNVIFENVVWTAQEVLDYYNDTKSNYWIS